MLGSAAKLRKLIKDELLADAKFGDAPLPADERDAAQALAETELVASEPVTIVLSAKGWARAAKGHDIDASMLSYREGDALLAAVRGRSNQQVVPDSTAAPTRTGAYTALGTRHGEPLTASAAGTSFVALACAEESQRFRWPPAWLRLRHPLREFIGRQKAGKQLINRTRAPTDAAGTGTGPESDLVVAITTAGHLLAFR